ncbi:MAG TPA: EAL domain-containing protein [Burkholderiales bacterium]|nr:EAL domain-containing protein [Burkholderiales bacterium]
MHKTVEGGPLKPIPTSAVSVVSPLDAAQILDSIGDAFVAVDREWRFTYLNRRAERVFRMRSSRLLGRYCWDLFPEGTRSQGYRRLHEAMAEGRSVEYLEYSLRFKIWYEVKAYPNPDGLSIYFRDVTERVAAEQKYLLHARAIEASVNAIVITTGRREQHAIVHVNPAFERITGYGAAEVIGKNCSFLQGADTAQPEIAAMRALLLEKKEGRVTLRNYRKDGTLFHNELHIAPVRSSKGHVTHYVGILNDITDTKRYQEELEHHVNHDALTGLANRHLLQDRLQQALFRANRRELSCAVMFLDLDHFKLVNDGLGHHVGDLLLKEVARELELVLRPEDTVARFGGDEFVLIATEVQSLAEVTEIAERIIARLCAPVALDGQEIAVSASLGVAIYPQDGETVDELLKNADAAMYHAKEGGRNAFSYYRREMNVAVSSQFAMKTKLAKAVENDELLLHYQPQADSKTIQLVGFEALVRWEHPELGRVAPDQFIPMAEESGLIVPIGEWVLLRACRLAADLRARGLDCGRVAVNLSARQFYQVNLAKMIERILHESGLPPHCLELEITESMMMGNTDKVLRILSELKEMSIQLAVDDFGTGYSSLGYLKRFPIDRLKIDRSFIDDVATSQHDATITKAIISLAHNLNLQVIAEGVENRGQLDFLASNGCDEIQGYLLSRPLDESALRRFVQGDQPLIKLVALESAARA